MQYWIADRTVESAVPLPELRVAQTDAADWHIARACAPLSSRGKAFHYWKTPQGYRWATFSRDRERDVMHFARTASFVVDHATGRVTCHPIGSTTEDAWRPVLLNQVFPLLLGKHRLVLHASAVATPAGAVVFAGAPGRGKSTLAAALALGGLPLITDDFLVIDQSSGSPVALPSGVDARLWPDSVDAILPGRRRQFPPVGRRTLKRRLAQAVPVAIAPQPIIGVFVLSSPGTAHAVDSLSPGAAVSALTASTFVAHVDDRAVVCDTFRRVTALVASVPVRQLTAVRDFDRLEGLCDIVRGAVRAA